MLASIHGEADKKKRLFAASAYLFARKGFEATTVDEIAEAAKVAKGTVYYYFKGKEDLFLFLVEEGLKILTDRVVSCAKQEPDTRRAIQKVVQAQLEFFQEYRDLCLIVLAESWGTSARQEKLQQLISSYYQKLSAILDRGIAENIIKQKNSELLTTTLFGATVMVTLHFIRKKQPVDWDEIENQLQSIWEK